MKYIVFGPTFPASDKMFDDLKNKSDILYDNNPVKNHLLFLLMRFHLNRCSFLPCKTIWKNLFKIYQPDDKERCFIYCNPWYEYMMETGYITVLKKMNPNSTHIVYFTDIHSAKNFCNEETIKKFDALYIFDKDVASDIGISYFPLMVSMPKELKNDKQYDLVFIGQSKGRYDKLVSVFKYLSKHGLRGKCIITNSEKNTTQLNGMVECIKGGFSVEESIDYMNNSRCILELKNIGIDALSDRVTKAVVYNCKVLTDNPCIIHHKYYNPDFVQVFDDVNSIDISFFNDNSVDYQYNGDYSPCRFIDEINRNVIGLKGGITSDMKNKNVNSTFTDEKKSAIAYTLGTLISRGLIIITLPIFTRIMTTSQIGEVNLYNSWFALIGAFATLSLTSGGYIVALEEFQERRDKYQSSVLSLTSMIALSIALLYFISPSVWNRLLGLPGDLMILMLVGFLLSPATDFWLARKRYEYEYKLPVFIMIASALLASLASILVVLYLNRIEYPNVVFWRLIANNIVIYGVALIIGIRTFIKGRVFFDRVFWTFSLKLSIPLVGYAIASQILSVSDRTMISKMVNNSAVGIYSVLYSVSSISILIWQAIHASFVPYLFKNIKNPKNIGNIKRISNNLVFMYSLIAVCMTYLAPEIIKIIATEEYYDAIYIMPPIAAGVFFTCFINLFSDIPVYYKKTKYVMYPALVAALINLVLNYYLINLFGYYAAAYTTLVAYIIWALLQLLWSKKVCEENGVSKGIFDDSKLVIIAAITVVLCLIAIPLYRYWFLRYSSITIIIILMIALVKKNKVQIES